MHKHACLFILSAFTASINVDVLGEELLLNTSFESGTGELLNPYGISEWVGYGNQERSREFALTGEASLKMFGGLGNTGLYQVTPIPPGRRLHVKMRFFTPSGDALGGTVWAGIRIEFLGRAPEKHEVWVIDASALRDEWRQVQLSIANPPLVGVGRCVLMWSDGPTPSGSVYWDAASVVTSIPPPINRLVNAGFESGEGGLGNPYGLDRWVAFGNAELSREAAFDGSGSLKIFGGFGFSGAFQDIRYSPDGAVVVNAYCKTRSGDVIAGSAIAGLVMEWPGPILSTAEALVAGPSTPKDTWLERTAILVPPEGTIAARVVLAFNDGPSPSGSAYFDDVSMLAVLPGDVDGNGRVDGRDIQYFSETVLDSARSSEYARAAADIGSAANRCTPDGAVTVDDVEGFIQLLIAGACE